MSLKFTNYVHRPLVIEAIEITDENLEEVAEIIGRVTGPENDRKILTDDRIIRGFRLVRPGWWLTKVGDSYRCYNPAAFERTFERVENRVDSTDKILSSETTTAKRKDYIAAPGQ